MSPRRVLYEKASAIAMLTIHQPQTGEATGLDLGPACLQALDECAQDDQARLLLFTDLGDQFCAGLGAGDGTEANHGQGAPTEVVAALVEKIHALPQPVLAAVGGGASGVGFELSLACDLVVASMEATFQPSNPAGTHVLAPRSVSRLLDLIGNRQATQLLLSNQALSAQEAYGMGLINRVVAREVLIEATWNWAEELSSLPKGHLTNVKARVR